MADFSISFEEGSDVMVYLDSFKQRIAYNAYFDAKLFIEGNQAFFHIKPLLFPIYRISPIIWAIGWGITGRMSWPLFVIGGIPSLIFPLYTKYWYILFLYLGKWRGKIKGKITVL